MAIIKTNYKSIEVADGQPILDVCEELGVHFSCRAGRCGACKIDIVKGEKNLSELTEKEIAMGDCDKKHRLACQVKINQGMIKIKFD
ncbi:MAG: 2Fe-2S iron-sulfur cluster binding domain-containing protein [Nanoarchaeota archaeon]|mgnify:CR=1 FL=1